MSKQVEKISPESFRKHGLTTIDTATVVHAMGGSMIVATLNDLIDLVDEIAVRIVDDEVVVNGKRYKLVDSAPKELMIERNE